MKIDMKHEWTLFGFSDALGDIIDVIESNDQLLSNIVLNTQINNNSLNKYLSIYTNKVNIIGVDKFNFNINKLYNFGFFVPEKANLISQLLVHNISFSNLIHKHASLSNFSSYGNGLLIGPQAVVTAGCHIGDHVRLNRSASIGHDCVINDYVHVGPAAAIAGHCKIGEGTFIGAGVIVKDHVSIGKNNIIGAGSLVLSDIPDNVIAYGTPAKVIRKITP